MDSSGIRSGRSGKKCCFPCSCLKIRQFQNGCISVCVVGMREVIVRQISSGNVVKHAMADELCIASSEKIDENHQPVCKSVNGVESHM